MSVVFLYLLLIFWVNSTGCSGEFRVVFKYFQNLENLISNILKEKLHISCLVSTFFLKGALSSLRRFFGNWKPFENDEKCYFTLKVLFALKIFKFLFWLFGHVEKRLDYKDKLNFKTCDVTTCLTNNCNAHIDLYLKK